MKRRVGKIMFERFGGLDCEISREERGKYELAFSVIDRIDEFDGIIVFCVIV